MRSPHYLVIRLGAAIPALAMAVGVMGGCGPSSKRSIVGVSIGGHPGGEGAGPGSGGAAAPSDGGLAGGDDGGITAGDDGSASYAGGSPFEPVGVASYVPKVKNVLTGLAATDAELRAVALDPAALRGLIDQWMTLAPFQQRMLDFFRNAFQQNHVTLPVLLQNIGLNVQISDQYVKQFERSVMDSFPLTVWELLKEGQPLNAAITTNRYMLTTAMMSLMSLSDEINVGDNGKTLNRLEVRKALAQFTLDPTSTNTQADSLDPTSSKFMTWHLALSDPKCMATTPVTLTGPGMYVQLFNFLMGKVAYAPCGMGGAGTQRPPPQFADTDWTDYRMVTLHVTDAATPYASPIFYDIPRLRAATDLTLHAQRIGFFGTLAFDANWATNVSNEARVTANQSLIVGIGQSINGESIAVSFPINATDGNHASNPACAGCHSQLDPYKQFFRQSYTLTYHDQTDTTELSQPAGFSIDGVNATGQGVGKVAEILATHPRFALAWVLKLHFWANSTTASDTDPEVVRIATAFQQSNFDFKTLVRELFSSPLITYASGTQTTQEQGVILSIARRDQYCAALSNRLGLTDVCGMQTLKPTTQQTTLGSRAELMPVDTYYRAYALPSLPTNPDLFFRDATESMCQLLADQVVDAKTVPSRYSSLKPDAAIGDFVSTVMGLVAADPRAAQAQQILTDNFTAAQQGGASASDSLKATFTLACIAPSSVIVGL